MSWLVLVLRLPSEPARHRVAAWRELRKAGAVPLSSGTWALPDLPVVAPVVDRVAALVARAEDGELVRLRAGGWDEADEAAMAAMFAAARDDEWRELASECRRYLAEIAKEHRTEKYSLAELEEEEQSLDRLRRWYRDVRARDLLGSSGRGETDALLKECVAAFDEFAEAVYARIGA
ncbi:Chromate resistance protein ChrB [Nocardioides iriomotensis]|uniref:Chromate resistance protein ChrB n=1 Tax=Nocardioides iriomotensis TaxID=715784 RepID=A0A4Q5IVS9_9ACTN|nr:Chromate resistance protein ChrB [Nocardioides iriomotensis]RYU10147.1 chromate resistance protein ChrB [Nocardioides iriomotensis]